MENNYKVLAICTNCGKCKTCGENCQNCNDHANYVSKTVKYAGALKDAIKCWKNADCEEHNVPCKPTVREFAEKIMQMQERIDKLESGIRSHKEIKQTPDACDAGLWDLL